MGLEWAYLDQLVVEGDGCISLPGEIGFMSKEISDVFYLVLDHCWSFLFNSMGEVRRVRS